MPDSLQNVHVGAMLGPTCFVESCEMIMCQSNCYQTTEKELIHAMGSHYADDGLQSLA